MNIYRWFPNAHLIITIYALSLDDARRMAVSEGNLDTRERVYVLTENPAIIPDIPRMFVIRF